MTHSKLFIPGPVEVPADTLAQMARPMIGHRSPEYRDLHGRVIAKLRELLGAERSLPLLFTSSATGVMEGAIRNCVTRRVLNLVCGAFSQRWHEISRDCGREAVALTVDQGQAISPAAVKEALAKGGFDAVTLVHNESSSGVMNDLPGIARAVREVGGEDVLLLVDAVTSMAAVPIPVDELDLDVCLAGSQKAFALPPVLAIATLSKRALDRARTIPGRGFYFDFVRAASSAAKSQTPATPAISLIYALDHSLDRMFKEGLEARYARHRALAQRCRSWARQHFALFPAERDASITLTVITNTRNIAVPALQEHTKKRGFVIANGYEALKDKTFRIGHMGEVTVAELDELLAVIDEHLAG